MTEPDQAFVPGRSLVVRARDDQRGTVLEIAGEVDLANAEQFEAALSRALRDEPRILVVDLSQVAFLGSVGLSHLVRASQVAAPGVLRVVAVSKPRRTLAITALDQVLRVSATVDEALGINA